MQQNYRGYVDRVLALAADRRFALQVLNESIREVVGSTRPARGLVSRSAAVRADEFHAVFERIAVERGASGIAKSQSFLGCFFHGRFPEVNLHSSINWMSESRNLMHEPEEIVQILFY